MQIFVGLRTNNLTMPRAVQNETANWTLSYSAELRAIGSRTESSLFIADVLEVFNASTNQPYLAPGSLGYTYKLVVDKVASHGFLNVTGTSQKASVRTNVLLPSGARVYVYVALWIWVKAVAGSPSIGMAWANLNMASRGNHATLDSISFF